MSGVSVSNDESQRRIEIDVCERPWKIQSVVVNGKEIDLAGMTEFHLGITAQRATVTCIYDVNYLNFMKRKEKDGNEPLAARQGS